MKKEVQTEGVFYVQFVEIEIYRLLNRIFIKFSLDLLQKLNSTIQLTQVNIHII